MAKQRSRATPGPSTSATAPAPAARGPVRPSAAELERARQDALIQLKIGRSAHYYSVVVTIALLLDGFLVLYLQPGLQITAAPLLKTLFPALFPLGAGLILAGIGVQVKWQSERFSHAEPHFIVSWAALAYNIVLAFLLFARLAQVGPTQHWSLLPTFYPLALLGIALPLIGMALTWQDWSQRKIASIVASAIPVPLALALYLPEVTKNPTAAASGLATTFFVGAALFQTAGSFLHLISSGTEVHEREVMQGGQGQLSAFAEELQRRDQALSFREQTLIRREADVESSEAALHDRTRAHENDQAALDAFEADVRKRGSEVVQREQAVQLDAAKSDATRQAAEDKEATLKLQIQQLASRQQRLIERERSVGDRESDLGRRELEVKSRGDDQLQKVNELKVLEARLTSRQAQLEAKTAEMMKLESDLRGREGLASVASADRTSLAAKTQEVAKRDVELSQLRARLEEERQALTSRTKQLEGSFEEAKKARDELGRREQALTIRDLSVKQLETESTQKAEAARQLQTQYQEAVKRAAERLQQVEAREGKVGVQVGEVDRIGQLLSTRESSLKEKETEVSRLRDELTRRERNLIERERINEAKESELSVRSLSQSKWPELSGGGSAAASNFSERERMLDIRERQLKDKEQQLIRQRAEAAATVGSSEGTTLAPPTVTRQTDRLPTGTPRLDDLLAGGFPAKAHVLMVGPAFTGKEILLYSFVAEGLRRGEPALLVTTTRSPDEIAADIGKVSSQFREYEQLGLVTWIDASNPAADPASSKESSRVIVRGPSDHAGILTGLVKAAQMAEKTKAGSFRVGFLNLSTCLAQSDEKEAFSFFQNFVGILKARPALAVYLVDQGTVPDARIEVAQGRIDGAIKFKQDRDRAYLSVQGLGDVQTRDWVEYRATNRQLIIGSFALERIR
ncbi:MAG: ATPase domain-containing protein [Thermoplasmata archaeon]